MEKKAWVIEDMAIPELFILNSFLLHHTSTVVGKLEFLVCVSDPEIKETCKERLVNWYVKGFNLL